MEILKKSAVLLVPFFLLGALSFAAGHQPGAGEKNSTEKSAEHALKSLTEAYQNRDMDKFLRWVHPEAYFNVADLKGRLDSEFNHSNSIELRMIVDQIIPGDHKALVKAHWQKRIIRIQTGVVENSEGQAHFIFKISDQETRLLDIQHDSPF